MSETNRYDEFLQHAQECRNCTTGPTPGKKMLAMYDSDGNQLICPWNREDIELDDCIPLCKKCRPHKGLEKKPSNSKVVNAVNPRSKSVNNSRPHIKDTADAKWDYLEASFKVFLMDFTELFPNLEPNPVEILHTLKSRQERRERSVRAATLLARFSEEKLNALLEMAKDIGSDPEVPDTSEDEEDHEEGNDE